MTPEEMQTTIDNEVKGAENAVKKMLLYYASALQTLGVEDVRQYIATRIGDMISLSDEQCKFILTNLKSENRIIDNLKNSIQLLNKMKQENKLDMESVDIIVKVMELILKDYDEFSDFVN